MNTGGLNMILNFLDRLKKWSDNFKIEDYKYDEYQCEISDFFKYSISKVKYENSKNPDFKLKINNFEGSEQFILFWRKKFSQEYFELQHPIHNNIKTKAICNFPADINNRRFGNYILFVDEDNKYPWIVLQVYEFFQLLITQEGIYHSPLSFEWFRKDANGGICGRLPRTINFHYNEILNNFFYKDIKFAWRLDKFRPFHYFVECLPGLWLQHLKKPYLPKSFFIPKFLDKSLKADSANYIGVYPNFCFTPLDRQAKDLADKNIVDEFLNDFNILVDFQDKLDKFDKEYISPQEINALLSY